MPIVNVILIGIGLSMDAVAVAVAGGMTMHRLHFSHLFRAAFFFGLFQAVMPVLGWLAGLTLRSWISRIDHWIAFFLLFLIGGKMVWESFSLDPGRKKTDISRLVVLFGLAVATSIDALAVGLSFSLLRIRIFTPVLIIGLITFFLTLLGGLAGHRFGRFIGKRIELAGGLILIGIGVKILLEHLGRAAG